MVTISLCMIVKDEEKVLENCLQSVQDFVDEIIIVDTGSEDKTKEIAKKYTQQVYDFPWQNDFALARNYSFSKATKQYCLWLDADDIITKENQEKWIKLKNDLDETIDIVMMPYHTSFDEDGTPLFIYERERLIKNIPIYQWEGTIHEVIPIFGHIKHSDIVITHTKKEVYPSNRNLIIYENLLKEKKKFNSRELYYYARELFDHEQYEKAIVQLKLFLSQKDAWIENKIDALRLLYLCYEKINASDELKLSTLFLTFSFDIPHAEICCEIGRFFQERNQYEKAIFWYQLALQIPMKTESGRFVFTDCYGFLPCIELAVCYDHIGNLEKACLYNEKAGTFKPNSKYVLMNRSYFENQFKGKESQ